MYGKKVTGVHPLDVRRRRGRQDRAGAVQRQGHRARRQAAPRPRGWTAERPHCGPDAARAEALERIAALQAELDDVLDSASSTTGDDEHDPEGATIGFERAQAQALLDQALAQLARIDAALTRRADGTYGLCVACGEPIAPRAAAGAAGCGSLRALRVGPPLRLSVAPLRRQRRRVAPQRGHGSGGDPRRLCCSGAVAQRQRQRL